MATKKPTAKQLAARKLFAQRAKSGAFARKAKRKTNPLTRVKRNSPSMATGKAPTKRLVKRRARTAKAPAGYYANPAKFKHSATAADRNTNLVMEKRGNRWVEIANFRDLPKAKEYAQAYADAHGAQLAIHGNFGAKYK